MTRKLLISVVVLLFSLLLLCSSSAAHRNMLVQDDEDEDAAAAAASIRKVFDTAKDQVRMEEPPQGGIEQRSGCMRHRMNSE